MLELVRYRERVGPGERLPGVVCEYVLHLCFPLLCSLYNEVQQLHNLPSAWASAILQEGHELYPSGTAQIII
jgi:hypothetical protein